MRHGKGVLHPVRPTVGLSTTQWQTPGLRRHWGSVALCSGPLRSHPSERGPQARAEGIVKSFPHCQQLLGSSGMWLRVSTRRSWQNSVQAGPLWRTIRATPSSCFYSTNTVAGASLMQTVGKQREEDLNPSFKFMDSFHIPSHIRARHW